MRERPYDLDARLVYADWLEERGDKRAEILRCHAALVRVAYDDDRFVPLARELLALGAKEARDWLDAIAWPDLGNTCWGKRSHDNDRNVIAMRRGGVLDYKREVTESPGTWLQVGNAVRWRINDYSTHEAAVIGDRIRGMAENDDAQEWTWAAVRLAPDAFDAQELPELPAEDTPRDTKPLKRGE